MYSELTNLLPPERQRALRRDYFVRLGVVTITLFIALTLSAGILLLPTYVFLTENAQVEKEHLASIESSVTSSDQATLSAQLTALSSSIATLSSLASVPSLSSIINTALAIPRPGITLSGFTYTSAAGKNRGTFSMSGTAMTRDALRNYQLALQGAPFARSADLPVSTFAKDSDISFTITVTLAP